MGNITIKENTANFEQVRRFMIVQMNSAGLDSMSRARVLRDLGREVTPLTLKACAEAIRQWRNDAETYFRASDLVHDIMGVIYEDAADGFVPRIKAIAEAYDHDN